MKTYGGLWEQVVSFGNLIRAARYAVKGARRTIEVQTFLFYLEPELLRLKRELLDGSYTPGPYRSFTVFDPKKRLISAASFRDRVVHHAVCDVMEPFLERIYSESSYACRKRKGTHSAVAKARSLLCCNRYFLKCDIRKFFESVDHGILFECLSARFCEKPLLALLNRIIQNPVPGCSPGMGLAIGNLTSQHFANLLLTELDKKILHTMRPEGYIRYMDDFVLFSDSIDSLHGYMYEIGSFLKEHLKLILKAGATFAAPVRHGLPFLGVQLFPSVTRLNGKCLRTLQKKVFLRTGELADGGIDFVSYRRSLHSIFGHIAHSDSLVLRRHICNSIGVSGE